MESARALLDGGADVNQTTEYGWTPLLAAVHNRHYRLAMVLLERGADPSLANQGGWTPLYLATDNRNIEAGDYPTRRPDGTRPTGCRRLTPSRPSTARLPSRRPHGGRRQT